MLKFEEDAKLTKAGKNVLDDGVISFFATYPPLPEFLVEWIKAGRDEQAIPVLEWIKKHDTYARWALQNHGSTALQTNRSTSARANNLPSRLNTSIRSSPRANP